MEELQLSLTPARVDQRNFGVMLSNWRVGQVLNALVVNTQVNGSVLLSIGGKQVVATTDLPVQAGTQLQLQVKQLGAEIVLRQIAPLSNELAGGVLKGGAAASTFASAGFAALFAQLAAANKGSAPPELKALARQVLARAMPTDKLSADDLWRAVRQSGVFAESELVQGLTHRAKRSPKGALAAIKQWAQQAAEAENLEASDISWLNRLADRASASMNGIVNQQLAAVPSGDDITRWVFTLPLSLNGEYLDLHMQVSRDAHSQAEEDGDPPWHIALDIDLPSLGALEINIRLHDKRVSVAFACGDQEARRLLDRRSAALLGQLETRAFEVAGITTEATAVAGEPMLESNTVRVEV